VDNEGVKMSNMPENKSPIATPADVERQLVHLSKEIDEVHLLLIDVEKEYSVLKAQYEIALARSRMIYATKSSPTGKNYTVTEREDMALLENEEVHIQMALMEASIKSTRGNMARLKTQVDIARSVGSSVRASMEV
jgi:hypothetical protein